MRSLILGAVACLALVPLACGGDDSTSIIVADSGSDTSLPDGSGKPDTSVADSSMNNDTSVPDAGGFDVVIPDANLACTDPSTCNGDLCCGSIVLGAGQPPQCPINSISSSCTKMCNTQLALMCNTTETVRLCAKNADCSSDKLNPSCCTFKQNNQSITFCTTKQIAQFAGGTCL
jgi:hypothetical protein